MSNPDHPFLPDKALSLPDVVDERLVFASDDDDEDDDEDDGDGKNGGGGGGRRGMNVLEDDRIFLPSLLEFSFDDDEPEDRRDFRVLSLLELAPMSLIAAGATAFASENDLSRKVFMAKVGLVTREIAARDIANPQMVKNLHEKQAERRTKFGMKTLDEIVGGVVGAAGMMVGAVVASVADYVKDKREERRIERKIREFNSHESDDDSFYSFDEHDRDEAALSLKETDFPVLEQQAVDVANPDAYDEEVQQEAMQRRIDAVQRVSDDGFDFSSLFNAVAVIAEEEHRKAKQKLGEFSGENEEIGLYFPQDFNLN